MRKFSAIVLSLCLFFSFALSVSADVIWEPYGDSFYDEHRSEMQYDDRFYKATKDLDYYKEPNGATFGDNKIFADELFNVQYLYEDENGIFWGNCFVPGEDSVWVKLDGCLRPYDRKDFENDYADTFEELKEQPDASFYADDIPLYDYPGAETALYNMTVQQDATYLPEYVHTYTDEAGNVWAELYYYMGMNGWILLDGDMATAVQPAKAQDTVIGKILDEAPEIAPSADATAEQTDPVSEKDAEAETDEPSSEAPIVEKTSTAKLLLPVLLVVAVAAVTLAILFVFFRKKKEK